MMRHGGGYSDDPHHDAVGNQGAAAEMEALYVDDALRVEGSSFLLDDNQTHPSGSNSGGDGKQEEQDVIWFEGAASADASHEHNGGSGDNDPFRDPFGNRPNGNGGSNRGESAPSPSAPSPSAPRPSIRHALPSWVPEAVKLSVTPERERIWYDGRDWLVLRSGQAVAATRGAADRAWQSTNDWGRRRHPQAVAAATTAGAALVSWTRSSSSSTRRLAAGVAVLLALLLLRSGQSPENDTSHARMPEAADIHRLYPDLHPDITAVIETPAAAVLGLVPERSWMDSYSHNGRCYCHATITAGTPNGGLRRGMANYLVETPLGWLTVSQVCRLLGPGPGVHRHDPVYNDVQCGNGPPSREPTGVADEHACPGRVDAGLAGCGQIGPTWQFDKVASGDVPPLVARDYPPHDEAHDDVVAWLPVPQEHAVTAEWANSYSVGDACYCLNMTSTTNANGENDMETFAVRTPLGWKSVGDVCAMLGPGPGIVASKTKKGTPMSYHPLYNDVQCGNGPPNSDGTEHACPGRVDQSPSECGHVGPKWNFNPFLPKGHKYSTEPQRAEYKWQKKAKTPKFAPYDYKRVPIAPGLHPDITHVLKNTGRLVMDVPPADQFDSYSYNGRCYCASKFHDGIGTYVVHTALGYMSVLEACDWIGEGPGPDGNPQYNDIQCGNGPPNTAVHEHFCPGRIDLGTEAGCVQIGPKWDFSDLIKAGIKARKNPAPPFSDPDIHHYLPVTEEPHLNATGWVSSYSVGNECYCHSNYEYDIGKFQVEIKNRGWMTVKEACDKLGPGPGMEGNPVYNDIQCGHGPPNSLGNEHNCPGRIDIGEVGCGQIGPRWHLP